MLFLYVYTNIVLMVDAMHKYKDLFRKGKIPFAYTGCKSEGESRLRRNHSSCWSCCALLAVCLYIPKTCVIGIESLMLQHGAKRADFMWGNSHKTW